MLVRTGIEAQNKREEMVRKQIEAAKAGKAANYWAKQAKVDSAVRRGTIGSLAHAGELDAVHQVYDAYNESAKEAAERDKAQVHPPHARILLMAGGCNHNLS